MAAIAVLLAFAGPEGRGDVVDVFQHDIEQASVAGRVKIGHGAFQHVPGAIELVVVAEIGPALFRFAADVPAVEVSVGKLGGGKPPGDLIDLRFDRRIAPVGEGIARRLDPLADVGVPKDLRGEIVPVARQPQRRRRLRDGQRFKDAVADELAMLARDRAGEDRLQPLTPEIAFDADVGEVHR